MICLQSEIILGATLVSFTEQRLKYKRLMVISSLPSLSFNVKGGKNDREFCRRRRGDRRREGYSYDLDRTAQWRSVDDRKEGSQLTDWVYTTADHLVWSPPFMFQLSPGSSISFRGVYSIGQDVTEVWQLKSHLVVQRSWRSLHYSSASFYIRWSTEGML
jgi:hypothetical protein